MDVNEHIITNFMHDEDEDKLNFYRSSDIWEKLSKNFKNHALNTIYYGYR